MEDLSLQKKRCRWLGIDYGERRIGLALTDELLIMAKPFIVIDAKEEDPVEKITSLIREKNICLVIIGNPIHLSGEESELSLKVKEFVKELQKKLPDGVEIVLYDERFTSRMAERMLANRGIDLRKNKKEIDLYAATFLLQEYLDYHK